MKDIGSIYPIDSLEPPKDGGRPLPFDNEPNVRYFSLCREALSAIARSLDRPQGKVLIPAYTCQTVITPFQELGWECRYYGITEDLRIDVESFKSLFAGFHPDVVVVHPYYGRDLNENELAALHAVKEESCVFVEDLTQCLFSKQRDDVFDYFVGSMRKWFPIPDGGFVFSLQHALEVPDALDENVDYVTTMLDAMFLRGVYCSSGDVRIKDVSRRLDKTAGAKISTSIRPHAISSYSRFSLSNIDSEAVQRKRMGNFTCLFDNLKSGEIQSVCKDLSEVTTAPLYFPVLAKNRADLIQRLIAQQIYAPVLWPVKTESAVINSVVGSIYDHILAIPCDQRYGEDGMRRICGVVNG